LSRAKCKHFALCLFVEDVVCAFSTSAAARLDKRCPSCVHCWDFVDSMEEEDPVFLAEVKRRRARGV
jgi:hypothetical protein